MASVAPRGGSRRRRAMNEINMVPFIDEIGRAHV
jgi:hypothetical protein